VLRWCFFACKYFLNARKTFEMQFSFKIIIVSGIMALQKGFFASHAVLNIALDHRQFCLTRMVGQAIKWLRNSTKVNSSGNSWLPDC
jgi:hypothetical protein